MFHFATKSAAKQFIVSVLTLYGVKSSVVQFSLNEAGRSFAVIDPQHNLAQLVINQNEDEERPWRKPPRPSRRNNKQGE